MERDPAEVRLDMFVMEYSLIDNVIDPCTTHLGPISRRVIDFEDAHKEVGILQIVNTSSKQLDGDYITWGTVPH